jgi:hypothetical protein
MTTKSRRDVICAAAGVALAPAIATTAITHAIPDPILELIEEHKRAWSAFDAATDRLGAAERSGDAQQLRHHNNAWRAAAHIERTAAWKLVLTPIASIAGAAALLHHASEFERAGNTWPNADDNWQCALRDRVADTLDRVPQA